VANGGEVSAEEGGKGKKQKALSKKWFVLGSTRRESSRHPPKRDLSTRGKGWEEIGEKTFEVCSKELKRKGLRTRRASSPSKRRKEEKELTKSQIFISP